MSFLAEEGIERFGGDNMPKFNVEITETLQKIVTVEAEDEAEALSEVEEMHREGTYILDADNFMGVDFYVVDENCNRILPDES